LKTTSTWQVLTLYVMMGLRGEKKDVDNITLNEIYIWSQ